jgi:hypothetical protein
LLRRNAHGCIFDGCIFDGCVFDGCIFDLLLLSYLLVASLRECCGASSQAAKFIFCIEIKQISLLTLASGYEHFEDRECRMGYRRQRTCRIIGTASGDQVDANVSQSGRNPLDKAPQDTSLDVGCLDFPRAGRGPTGWLYCTMCFVSLRYCAKSKEC